jgi:glycine/D-amino acid oxidase-like deaminating enzyme
VGHRGTAELPETADVVVVGSGITGGFAARFLLEGEGVGEGGKGEGEGEGLRVVMLEAREVCSGATGRVSLLFFFFFFGCSVFFMGHGEEGWWLG